MNTWKNFWYEWVSYGREIRFGSNDPTGYYKFRKQRLINLILGLLLLIILYNTI